MAKINNYGELIEKVNKLKKDGGIDLPMEEDLSIAVMNLISLRRVFVFLPSDLN